MSAPFPHVIKIRHPASTVRIGNMPEEQRWAGSAERECPTALLLSTRRLEAERGQGDNGTGQCGGFPRVEGSPTWVAVAMYDLLRDVEAYSQNEIEKGGWG